MKQRNRDRYRSGPVAVGALLMLLCVGGALADNPTESDELALLRRTGKAFSSVARKAMPAVVFIQVEKTVDAQVRNPHSYNNPQDLFGDEFLQRFFGQEQPQLRQRQFKQSGQGSGFLVSKDGYILTNNHVVGDADKIKVKLSDGREFEAERIGADPKSEVAVIKIDADDLPYVAMGDSDKLEIGEWVVAIGNPFGLTETLTVGVVSAKGRSNMGIADYEDFIQTDAAINPGNSGGALLNINGEVIGINTAIYSQNGGYMGIGFAIPINMARVIKDQLVQNGKVVRGYLGIHIQDFTDTLAESFGVEESGGILVSQVEKDSPADKAGIKQEDIIRKMNGKRIKSVSAFRNEVSSNPPGSNLDLAILRGKKTIELTAKTGALPGESDGTDTCTEICGKLGMAVQDLTAELAERFGYELGEGVIVTQVEADGIAAQAGISPGNLISSVNRALVRDSEEFHAALAGSKSTGTVLLRVNDGRYSRFIVLSLN